MDRFREVSDDESLNKLHEEWKKFKKKKSLELHPDKGGNKDDFTQFNEKKEIIDGFFLINIQSMKKTQGFKKENSSKINIRMIF